MDKEETIRKIAEKMADEDQWNEMLPSKGRDYPKKKKGPQPGAKSYERHMREKDEKVAREYNMSATTLRRARYISKFGSKELRRLCDEGEIAIRTAYFIARREHEAKVWRAMEEVMKEQREGCEQLKEERKNE